MTLTVQQLSEHLVGFSAALTISIKDGDGKEFFITNFTPRGNVLNIRIDDEEEDQDTEEG